MVRLTCARPNGGRGRACGKSRPPSKCRAGFGAPAHPSPRSGRRRCSTCPKPLGPTTAVMPGSEAQRGGGGEGFESAEGEFLEIHGVRLFSVCQGVRYPICLGCGLPDVGGIVGDGACVGAGRAGAGVTGVTGLFLAESRGRRTRRSRPGSPESLEVVGGLIPRPCLPADPNRPGQPPADERP